MIMQVHDELVFEVQRIKSNLIQIYLRFLTLLEKATPKLTVLFRLCSVYGG